MQGSNSYNDTYKRCWSKEDFWKANSDSEMHNEWIYCYQVSFMWNQHDRTETNSAPVVSHAEPLNIWKVSV